MSPRRADAIKNGIGQGPSWYDAWDMLRAMEKQYDVPILLTMAPARSVPFKFGWRVTATLEGSPELFGCGCFGPAFPGTGQKSYAAAVYRALLALDEEIATAWAKRDAEDAQLAEIDSAAR